MEKAGRLVYFLSLRKHAHAFSNIHVQRFFSFKIGNLHLKCFNIFLIFTQILDCG